MQDVLWQYLVKPLTEPSFQKALIGGSLVAIVCGVIGCFVILRRMAFLGDALSHAMLAGVTAGYLFMQLVFGYEAHVPAMIIGSILAGLITVGLISFVSKVSRIKEDTAIGIMYTGIFSIGGILASVFSRHIHIDLYHFIVGMVLGVEDADLWMIAVITALVLGVVILLFRHLQITTFDPVMAASIGIPVTALDYLLTTCTSLVVVAAVGIVGVILVVGLLVTPAATAYLLSDRLSRMMMLAAFFGTLSVALGLYLSTWIGNVATGPSIVLASSFLFVVVLIVAPRYGLISNWLRRQRMVPQQIIEDILGCFRYGQAHTTTVDAVLANLGARPDQIQRAIRSMERQDLLARHGRKLKLTRAGQREARRLLRAHRLWETYLKQVGAPEAELHEMAHALEHLHDEATVDYLDDKLGHPLRDPHGAEIPEDFVDLVPGAVVKSSLLRQGRAGIVTQVDAAAAATPAADLKTGTRLVAGPRSSDGKVWSFRLPNGSQMHLDHQAADAVQVRLANDQEQGQD